MNPIAKRLVVSVQSAVPSFDVIAAWDDIAELNRLADEMAKRPAGNKYDPLGTPVIVGGVKLYRPTIGSNHFEAKFCEWFSDKPSACDVAAMFAMAHAHTPARTRLWKKTWLHELDSPQAAWDAVDRWARLCSVSAEEMIAGAESLRPKRRGVSDAFKVSVLRAILKTGEPCDGAVTILKSLDERAPADDDSDGLGAVLSWLCEVHGNTPEYWIWEASEENVMALLHAKTTREIAAHKSADDKQAVARELWEDEAHARFRAASLAFKKKYAPDMDAPKAEGAA